MDHSKRDGKSEMLPPPPPVVPPNVVPQKAFNRLPMARPGVGSVGQRIPLLTNHFNVSISKTDDHFYHYSVCIFISIFSLILGQLLNYLLVLFVGFHQIRRRYSC